MHESNSTTSIRDWRIPIYYTPRFYFGQRQCIPFFDFRIGAFLEPYGVTYKNLSPVSKESHSEFGGGMYYAAFLGMEFGKHVDLAFGTDQFLGGMTDSHDVFFNLTITAKMAVCF